jgi:cytochrome c biogenesis protein CcdA
MKIFTRALLCFLLAIIATSSFAQDAVINWKVSSKKTGDSQYQLIFTSDKLPDSLQLYAPAQGLETDSLNFADSSVQIVSGFTYEGAITEQQSKIFEGQKEKLHKGSISWTRTIRIVGTVPATIQGNLIYSYAKDGGFFQGEFNFTVPLEGGVAASTRIKISSIDVKHPVNPCGDDDTENKSLLTIFILGFTGGLIALVTPCVFPLIPLTVSFFTKRSGNRKKGIRNAVLYGLSIFLIYVLLSLPFHLIDKANPEILNNISTNMWVNLVFFVLFILFALSFFGLYELTLPGGLASKIDSKSGINDIWGIFFMALTLAIVSFSCTGPILGSLLAGVSGSGGSGGATQLSFGMAGFGVGLGLPFALFALFPGWLQSLPKSGGWLNSVKVVLGFLELGLAVKFLSNADLVEQWHFLKREIFIGIWVVISLLITLYLAGILRFGNQPKAKMTKARTSFIALFAFITLYLLPGVTNTAWANLKLISGFPPPLCYSVYKQPVNCVRNVQPEHDYEVALQRARKEGKPLLIDFTGWACVNCRRMEENVWTNPEVGDLMKNKFVVVSLYVDERKKLPLTEQMEFTAGNGDKKQIVTIGDKWANFQIENFYKTSQPQYAIISPEEIALTKTKTYTPAPREFAAWLKCGLDAYSKQEAVSTKK